MMKTLSGIPAIFVFIISEYIEESSSFIQLIGTNPYNYV